jgi:hypothetical protein
VNRDFFRRGTRFSHTYGALEAEADPLQMHTFRFPRPTRIDQLCSPPVEVQNYGERRWGAGRSAVVTPAGRITSLEGPDPDRAFSIAMPIPVNTVARKSGTK